MNRIKQTAATALLAAGSLIAIALLVFVLQASTAGSARAQTTDTTTKTDIGVSGVGRVSVDPDTAIASVGVEITAATLEAATSEASTKMTAVLAAIKAQGVDAKDIQTSSYNVYPISDTPKEGETSKVTGYRVSNIVTVKIRTIANVGKVLDAALTAGANSVNSVNFTVNDPSKAQDDARVLAVKDAMAKAGTLATAAGVKVGKLISISDITGGVVPFYNRADAVAVPAAVGGGGPVETGQTEIVVNVEMHFEIVQ